MKFLTATVLAFSLVIAPTAYADNDHDDHIERQVQMDADFNKKQNEAITILKKRGYQVVKVEADEHRGKPALSIEAYKNGQEYEITMAYPSLKIIREKRDD